MRSVAALDLAALGPTEFSRQPRAREQCLGTAMPTMA